jgi:hypothetical protein
VLRQLCLKNGKIPGTFGVFSRHSSQYGVLFDLAHEPESASCDSRLSLEVEGRKHELERELQQSHGVPAQWSDVPVKSPNLRLSVGLRRSAKNGASQSSEV